MAASNLRSTSKFLQFLVEQELIICKSGNDAADSIPGKNLELPRTSTDMLKGNIRIGSSIKEKE
jgi:uncharacterized hydantoinase/oxoprolinase family protein